MLVDSTCQFRFWSCTYKLFHHFSVFKHHYRGNVHDSELFSNFTFTVNIKLCHFCPAVIFFSKLINYRTYRSAGATPRSQKSTITTLSEFNTSCSKFSFVKITTFSPAIIFPPNRKFSLLFVHISQFKYVSILPFYLQHYIVYIINNVYKRLILFLPSNQKIKTQSIKFLDFCINKLYP